jgi:hypothetical protein
MSQHKPEGECLSSYLLDTTLEPSAEILSVIVNYREKGVPGGPGDIRVGKVAIVPASAFNSPNKPYQCTFGRQISRENGPPSSA